MKFANLKGRFGNGKRAHISMRDMRLFVWKKTDVCGILRLSDSK